MSLALKKVHQETSLSERRRTEGRNISVARTKEEHVNRDLSSRAVDCEGLVEGRGGLEEGRLLEERVKKIRSKRTICICFPNEGP